MNLNTIILMTQPNGEGSGMSTLIMLGAMAIVFYFFMIRPQVKKQKEQKNFRESLKTGDKIVTIGGIHGKITAMQETTATIKVEDGSTFKIEKSAVVADFAVHQQQGGKR
jgi:preprotein translocase subunit YajC